jgi:hypothetical protein
VSLLQTRQGFIAKVAKLESHKTNVKLPPLRGTQKIQRQQAGRAGKNAMKAADGLSAVPWLALLALCL